jgi:pyruvate dehydrogenase E2 component (dihydrolipoamide acetyltransferase)
MGTHHIPVPQLGMTAEEATIVAWLFDVGAEITAGDILVVVETEKSDIEVEAPVAGWLRSVTDVGSVLAIGVSMAVVTDTPDEAVETSVPQPVDPAPDSVQAAALPISATPAKPVGGRVAASPAARRRAAELGIDIASVAGSGPDGRVVESDVEAAYAARIAAPTSVGPSTVTLSSGRRAVAKVMTLSAAIPQISVGRRVPMRAAREVVAAWKRQGADVSVTDVLLGAFARALAAHPRFAVRTSSIDDVRAVASIDIAIAIPSGDYLEAPALRAVDRLDLPALADGRRRLVQAVQDSALSAGDLGEPCATLSNLGPFGVDEFHALITPPQSCALACGTVRAEPAVVDGQIAIVPSVQLWLTGDHRVADGGHMAELLATCADVLVSAETAFGPEAVA